MRELHRHCQCDQCEGTDCDGLPQNKVYGCNLDTIKPSPDCFGKWQGLDSEKCKSCHIWGYCADLEARTATIRNATLDTIDKFCKTNVIKGASEQWDSGYNTGMGDVLNKCKNLRTNQEPKP